ncbi:hypothetical protein [Marinobacter sp.]|uniref:hypothetical protein n=1 Tax=Marinobacter sp. TaxID=50741 RepID=UPI00262FFB05|nr:hypothetical protein [Marinobacter sp.]
MNQLMLLRFRRRLSKHLQLVGMLALLLVLSPPILAVFGIVEFATDTGYDWLMVVSGGVSACLLVIGSIGCLGRLNINGWFGRHCPWLVSYSMWVGIGLIYPALAFYEFLIGAAFRNVGFDLHPTLFQDRVGAVITLVTFLVAASLTAIPKMGRGVDPLVPFSVGRSGLIVTINRCGHQWTLHLNPAIGHGIPFKEVIRQLADDIFSAIEARASNKPTRIVMDSHLLAALKNQSEVAFLLAEARKHGWQIASPSQLWEIPEKGVWERAVKDPSLLRDLRKGLPVYSKRISLVRA